MTHGLVIRNMTRPEVDALVDWAAQALIIKPATRPDLRHTNEIFFSDLLAYLPRKRCGLGRIYDQGRRAGGLESRLA